MMTNFDMQEIAPGIIQIIRNGRPTTDEIMHYVSTVWELPVHSTRPFFGKSKSEHKLWRRLCPWIENFTDYQIGRIYDVIYLCRRWEGNSMLHCLLRKSTRIIYIKTGFVRGIGTAHPATKNDIRGNSAKYRTVIPKANSFLGTSQRKLPSTGTVSVTNKKISKWFGNNCLSAKLFFNPKRILSATAQTDTASIHSRPCFLCQTNRPQEQEFISYRNYQILVNPYPIFKHHFTIVDKEHKSQSIAGRFKDMIELTDIMEEYFLLYNGPESGASAPDHAHFQACSKEGKNARTILRSHRFNR